MNNNNFEKVREFARQIQEGETYRRHQTAIAANDECEELQKKIKEFNEKREALQAEFYNVENRDMDKMNELEEAVKKCYEELMEMPTMVVYNEASSALNMECEIVRNMIQQAYQGIAPEELTSALDMGCSGDCGECSGC